MSVKINLFHIFIIAPLLLAIDHYQQSKPELWLLLGYNSIIILFFVGLPISELGWSSWYNLISLTHWLIWVLFFAWLSWKGYTTTNLDNGYYLLVRWLAFMLIGIHGYLLIGKINSS